MIRQYFLLTFLPNAHARPHQLVRGNSPNEENEMPTQAAEDSYLFIYLVCSMFILLNDFIVLNWKERESPNKNRERKNMKLLPTQKN